jgi:hypothetical protein
MLRKTLATVFCLLLLAGRLTGECYDPVFASPKEEPVWVNGSRPPETGVSYYDVARGEGRNYETAYANAEKEIVRKRSFATGRQAQLQDSGISLSKDNLEVLAKIERMYLKQCRADEYSVYLLVQIGKRPGTPLPPFQEDWLTNKKTGNEKNDKEPKKKSKK